MAINVEPDRISMVSIGSQLKAAREKKNLTLDQAQKQTRIYSAVLGALEDGRCDEMLTVVYVKGFLKKYAEFLGLDSRALLKEYDVLHSISRHSAVMPQHDAQKDTSISPLLQPKTSIRLKTGGAYGVPRIIIITVIIAVSALLAVSIVRKAADAIKGRKPATKVKVSAAKVPAESQSKPQAAKPAPVVTPPKPEVPKSVPLKLEIYVKKPATVKVKVDGALRFGRYLSKGTRETVTAKDTINIYTNRAENIELTLNGQTLPVAAKGQVKDIEITRKGVKIK